MSFDRLAPYYRAMELVLAGEKLQRCRVACLDQVPAARRILLAGEGHGRFLEICLRRFPGARVTCVDASAAMLQVAARRCRAAGLDLRAVELIHAELPAWEAPKAHFDLLVTHFFLDCFPAEQLEEVVKGLAEAASHQARWLVADFAVPARGWRRWRARLILWLAYAFFRRATALPAHRLVSPDEYLERAGFCLERTTASEWGLLRSDLWVRGSDASGQPA